VEGRSEDSVAQLLSRYKLANAKRNDACNRITQLLCLEVAIVFFLLVLTVGAGGLHRPGSKSGHSESSRYQRGKETSIRAYRLADKDGDGKLAPDEVRTLYEDNRHVVTGRNGYEETNLVGQRDGALLKGGIRNASSHHITR
jgi:hypothetical protein